MNYTPRSTNVYVMRDFDVTGADDWIPQYKTRPISPRRVRIIWRDGVPWRAGVTGPYRLKNGKTPDETDENRWSGSGDPDFRDMYHYTESVGDSGIMPDGYYWRSLPGWVRIIAEAGPEQ